MHSSQKAPLASSWLLLLMANVFWSTSYVASKFLLQGLSVTMMLALRLALAALCLLPFVFLKRKELHLTRKDIMQLAILAFLGFVLNKLLEFGGLAFSTASDVALLITGESLFTAALSWFLLREPFKRSALISLLIGFFGVYLIVEQGLLPNLPAGGGIARIIGDLLVVLALLSEAFYTVRGKSLLARHNPLLVTASAIVGSMFFWGPVAGWEVLHSGWPHLDLLSWLALSWLAIMATAVAYLAWFQGLRKVDGSLAASTLFVQHLLATPLAVVLLHDHPPHFTITGSLLIIASVDPLTKQH